MRGESVANAVEVWEREKAPNGSVATTGDEGATVRWSDVGDIHTNTHTHTTHAYTHTTHTHTNTHIPNQKIRGFSDVLGWLVEVAECQKSSL